MVFHNVVWCRCGVGVRVYARAKWMCFVDAVVQEKNVTGIGKNTC